MDIRKYADYFHDGTIAEICKQGNGYAILMESSELLPEWNEDNIALSQDNTIRGILHIEDVQQYSEKGSESITFAMQSPDGDIMDFEVNDNHLLLRVFWNSFSNRKTYHTDLCEYTISAQKIWWENLPNIRIPDANESFKSIQFKEFDLNYSKIIRCEYKSDINTLAVNIKKENVGVLTIIFKDVYAVESYKRSMIGEFKEGDGLTYQLQRVLALRGITISSISIKKCFEFIGIHKFPIFMVIASSYTYEYQPILND